MKSTTPAVKNIMFEYGLTLATVSDGARCTQVEAYRALHPQHFRLCPLIMIARVRRAIEKELAGRGWEGSTEDLWADYDAILERHLRPSGKISQRRSGATTALSR